MFWTQYDKGNGGTPAIGDKVETCHLGEGTDGEHKGIFAGWVSLDRTLAIIIACTVFAYS